MHRLEAVEQRSRVERRLHGLAGRFRLHVPGEHGAVWSTRDGAMYVSELPIPIPPYRSSSAATKCDERRGWTTAAIRSASAT